MNMNRRSLLVAAACAALPSGLRAQTRKPVVLASFSILADLVRQVGGDRVEVRSLVPRNGDAHLFEIRPDHVRMVADADLLVLNGLNFESWARRLVQTAGLRGEPLVASRGVKALSLNGAVDPHAWQDVANVKIYVANIRDGLARLDPAGADDYARRAAAFSRQLDGLDAEIRATLQPVPKAARRVVTTHDAFSYFGDAYDVVFYAPQGLSTQAEASAAGVAQVVRQIREQKIRALFIEHLSDPRLLRQIARETGVGVGGALYADTLGDAPGYVAMMRHNARAIAAALREGRV